MYKPGFQGLFMQLVKPHTPCSNYWPIILLSLSQLVAQQPWKVTDICHRIQPVQERKASWEWQQPNQVRQRQKDGRLLLCGACLKISLQVMHSGSKQRRKRKSVKQGSSREYMFRWHTAMQRWQEKTDEYIQAQVLDRLHQHTSACTTGSHI